MLNFQKFYIERKSKKSVSERQKPKKSAIVKSKKNTAAKPLPDLQSLYLETDLGGRRHKILMDAKWKYIMGADDVYAIYKKGHYRIWVDKKGKWFLKSEKRTREVKWVTIFKKYLS